MSSPLVLITGATGFIGAETLYQLLEKGYRTRVTVRKEAQVAPLKARYPDAADRLEVIVIPRLDDEAALKTALSGVTYIQHVASPMPEAGRDLQTGYIEPAVNSTIAILDAAKAAGTVKRIIITSSALALAPTDFFGLPGAEIAEGTNRDLPVDVKAPAPEGLGGEMYKYHVSKILAHRATLDWAAANAKSADLDVVTVHPFYVIGHDRTQGPGEEPHGVNHVYLGSLMSPQPMVPSALVDVRDVAAVHVGAITVKNLQPRGSVTEVIAKGPHILWDAIVAFVKEKYPKFPVGLTSWGEGAVADPPTAKTERAERDFGVKQFYPPLVTVAEMMNQNYTA